MVLDKSTTSFANGMLMDLEFCLRFVSFRREAAGRLSHSLIVALRRYFTMDSIKVYKPKSDQSSVSESNSDTSSSISCESCREMGVPVKCVVTGLNMSPNYILYGTTSTRITGITETYPIFVKGYLHPQKYDIQDMRISLDGKQWYIPIRRGMY